MGNVDRHRVDASIVAGVVVERGRLARHQGPLVGRQRRIGIGQAARIEAGPAVVDPPVDDPGRFDRRANLFDPVAVDRQIGQVRPIVENGRVNSADLILAGKQSVRNDRAGEFPVAASFVEGGAARVVTYALGFVGQSADFVEFGVQGQDVPVAGVHVDHPRRAVLPVAFDFVGSPTERTIVGRLEAFEAGPDVAVRLGPVGGPLGQIFLAIAAAADHNGFGPRRRPHVGDVHAVQIGEVTQLEHHQIGELGSVAHRRILQLNDRLRLGIEPPVVEKDRTSPHVRGRQYPTVPQVDARTDAAAAHVVEARVVLRGGRVLGGGRHDHRRGRAADTQRQRAQRDRQRKSEHRSSRRIKHVQALPSESAAGEFFGPQRRGRHSDGVRRTPSSYHTSALFGNDLFADRRLRLPAIDVLSYPENTTFRRQFGRAARMRGAIFTQRDSRHRGAATVCLGDRQDASYHSLRVAEFAKIQRTRSSALSV